jgi:carbonic anhydrase/acetyltransferase-like protein (isoleucine patch superfamily)
LHACTVHDGARIESGALILDGVVVGKNAMVTSGSVVPAGKKVGEAEVQSIDLVFELITSKLWSGTPAKFIRKLEESEIQANETFVQQTLKLAQEHSKQWSKTEEERENEKDLANSYQQPKVAHA